MKEAIQRWHLDTLSKFSADMFNSLIQPYHITSPCLKEIAFEDASGTARGYFASKDRVRYWINEDVYPLLPIRVNEKQELRYKEDVIVNPYGTVTTFKIMPQKTMNIRAMVDGFCPFEHTNPDQYTMLKVIAIASYIDKLFICVSTEPNFAKSSVFKVIHALTDKCPVFKPRSVPGVLNKISGIGNIVFDEAHECKKDVRDIMEEFALDIGGGSTVYINGAMKSANTANKYDCRLQSITFLYNTLHCYKEPEKKYFEVIFSNNKAMDDRFLKLHLKGKLTQKFTRNFDIIKTAQDNRQYYIDFHKQLEWLREMRLTGKLDTKFPSSGNAVLKIMGRRKIVYDGITWLLDQYCQDQAEYDKFIKILEDAIINYKEMVSVLKEESIKDAKIEDIK